MSELILHHYWPSPVAEKVRKVFGIKRLAWRSVEIPRIPPKPELMPLTGGYRRTPVLQIGADIYCDSQCIISEIQRRQPQPTLYPGGAEGMVWGVSRWIDGELFVHAIAVVLGAQIESLPADFADDRLRLYFGPQYDKQQIAADLPHRLAQIRGQLAWMDQRLQNRSFMLGDQPGLPDALAWYLVWFIRGRYTQGPDFLAPFASLVAWEERMQAIGSGDHTELTAGDALQIARKASPLNQIDHDAADPQGLTPGQTVSVVPLGDGGDPVVSGDLIAANAHTMALARQDEQVGDVTVYFPRVGYRVTVH